MPYDLNAEVSKALTRAFAPLVDVADRLEAQIKDKERYISALIAENNELRQNHENSGLARDKPKNCRYRLVRITSGQFAGQNDTQWYCPSCGQGVSNWEAYCVACGQRLKREYLPDTEIKEEGDGNDKGRSPA